MSKLKTAQIGRCGELLVQYRLLRHGIESAQMTTDSGIDLVAYSPRKRNAITIQVKSNLRPKPSGGKGQMVLDWWLASDSPAELVALVHVEDNRVWLFRHAELDGFAQQHSSGRMHFGVYTDLTYTPLGKVKLVKEFAAYEIDERVAELFGVGLTEAVSITE